MKNQRSGAIQELDCGNRRIGISINISLSTGNRVVKMTPDIRLILSTTSIPEAEFRLLGQIYAQQLSVDCRLASKTTFFTGFR